MFKEMLLAGLGGFVGTCARYLTGRLAACLSAGVWPLGTFTVNIVGCFVFGLATGLARRHGMLSPGQSLLLITGFCGGFTTFSAFANDMLVLAERQQPFASALYAVASVGLGIVAVLLGRSLAS